MNTQSWLLVTSPNEALILVNSGIDLYYQERHKPKEPLGSWCTYYKIQKMIASGPKLLILLDGSSKYFSVWRSETFYRKSE